MSKLKANNSPKRFAKDYYLDPITDITSSGLPVTVNLNGRRVPVTKMSSLIWNYKNGRSETVGYDDPTYFGFVIDIHSRDAEAESIINPFTDIRANPLFYFPVDAGNPNEYGKMSSLNKGTPGEFSGLMEDVQEASALHYLNHYGPNLINDYESKYSRHLPFKSSAEFQLVRDKVKPEDKELGRSYYLVKFKQLLNDIQSVSPWTFKEIEGVNGLWKAGFSESGVNKETGTVELTVSCDETIDLRVTQLAHYYKMLSYDSFNKRRMLPNNLEQFSMDIYFMDLRDMNNWKGSTNDPKSVINTKFRNQINFGATAYRCFGCTFDFSGMFDTNATGVKSSVPDEGVSPKFKIKIKRVLPATYFGTDSFGYAKRKGLTELGATAASTIAGDGALDNDLDFGPFTGGITRVLDTVKMTAQNLIATPQALLNAQINNLQGQFESAVDGLLEQIPTNILGIQLPNYGNPYRKGTVEEFINERRSPGLTGDVFQGFDTRTAPPINQDVFPGVDTMTAPPITTDVFPGVNDPTAPAITTDVFPGVDTMTAPPINQDVFPGVNDPSAPAINQDVFPGVNDPRAPAINQDVFPGSDRRAAAPIKFNQFGGGGAEAFVNQRRANSRIASQNPYKLK